MPKPLSFQQVIFKLEEFWAKHGCLLWQPYNIQVGAGTMNPATYLRVLGPEPWNVVYVEPSIRPDDGRYGDNPNRMQQHTQLQVILKPDPGNPQELYLESLDAIGIDRTQHDIRFVEDNWESPALGAWGLGWEVWLDGMEITQFTYFQQAGGVTLDPVSVEITYGLERIVMFLQDVRSVWDIDYDGQHTYGDVLLRSEVEHNIYNYELADVDRLTQMYALYEAEARAALEHNPPLVIPAHDYTLKCSHTFNLLDARGAIGVTERAGYFARMRNLARDVAKAYLEQRQAMEYPWFEESANQQVSESANQRVRESTSQRVSEHSSDATLDFVLEIGVEELPSGDVSSAIEQLNKWVSSRFSQFRLRYKELKVLGTPRRLAVLIEDLAPSQEGGDWESIKGPAVNIAFDKAGNPTQAAYGWAKKYSISRDVDLKTLITKDGRYLEYRKPYKVEPTAQVLERLLPSLISEIDFDKEMRWNASNIAFSRPIRWIVALLDDQVIPFTFADVSSGRVTRGARAAGSPAIEIASAAEYLRTLAKANIILDDKERDAVIARQREALERKAGGVVPLNPRVRDEVINLVEQPTSFLGAFEEKYLGLPKDVLITVMEKHQRYFPLVDRETRKLLPHFIGVRNGDDVHLDIVTRGNEGVLRARYADAEYFYKHDTQRKLEDYLPRLGTLTFQEKLGSMLDRTKRIEALVPRLAPLLNLSDDELKVAQRAAHLCKADLVTQMVVDFTSLQGIMGREYAKLSGESTAVADAIFEHYLPRYAGDQLPESKAGLLVGLADRVDSLIGLFAIGLAPTGSADPWALRRAALGTVQLLVEKQVSFPLRDALKLAAAQHQVKIEAKTIDDVLAFIAGRLRGWLLDQGYRFDAVDAVLAARAGDPYRAAREVAALTKWMQQPDWEVVLDNYARCVRITRDLKENLPLDAKSDKEPATDKLRKAYAQAAKRVKAQPDVDTLLNELRGLKDPIFEFFEKVMVNTEDASLRRVRQGLVQHIAALSDGIVDLSKVEGF